MIIFTLRRRNSNTLPFEIGYYIGDMEQLATRLQDRDNYEALEIAANGDEHDWLIAKFKNLPFAQAATRWKGHMAQFVWDNLAV